jgi:hypothetical protein
MQAGGNRQRATGNTCGLRTIVGCLLPVAGCLLPWRSAHAQGPVFEWGLHATASVRGTETGILNGPAAIVFGPRGAIRTLGSTRIAASVGAGTLGARLTGRGELALEYLLSPRASGRVGVYLGGGLAGVVGEGKGGYLLGYVGLERSPGLGGGWTVEAGLGGGFRVRVAYHWRRFPAGWRPQG